MAAEHDDAAEVLHDLLGGLGGTGSPDDEALGRPTLGPWTALGEHRARFLSSVRFPDGVICALATDTGCWSVWARQVGRHSPLERGVAGNLDLAMAAADRAAVQWFWLAITPLPK